MSNIQNDEIRLSGVIEESVVDGPGWRFVIFTQGCHKRCVGCHNSETQPLDAGYIEKIDNLRKQWNSNPLITGVTISGGEPFIQPDKTIQIVKLAKQDNKHVVVYSGYYYDQLRLMAKRYPSVDEILNTADILVDGPFEIHKKDLNLLFRGSANQRLIDLKRSDYNKPFILKEI